MRVQASPDGLDELARSNGTIVGAALAAAARDLDQARDLSGDQVGFRVGDVAAAVRHVATRFRRVDGVAWSTAVRFRRADAVHHLRRVAADLPTLVDVETRLHDILVWQRVGVDTGLLDPGDGGTDRPYEYGVVLDEFGCELGFLGAVATGTRADDCETAAAIDRFPVFREVAEASRDVQTVIEVLNEVVATVPGVTCLSPDSTGGERVFACTLDGVGVGAVAGAVRTGATIVSVADLLNRVRRALHDGAQRRRRDDEDEDDGDERRA